MGKEAAQLMLTEIRGDEPMSKGARVLVRGDLRWRSSVVPGPALPIQ
jgi:hypothetical protein